MRYGPDMVEALGRQVRAVRKRKGFSMEALAKEAGVNISTISRLESGLKDWPSLGLILSIADALTVHHTQLLPADWGIGERA